ncbi:protein phosphatase regulator [Blastocladiella emersonii ATCC 22665]|nr:protein phosphatase regulator [Blastocladiella emersonii ATCC 22665]
MATISEEPELGASSSSAAAALTGSGSGSGSGDDHDHDLQYDSSSSTNSGASGNASGAGGRRSRNPGLTIDTASSNAAAATAAGASSNGAASPTSPSSASPTAPMTPSTPLSDDVDFSLVYALHTFVATMEGQVAVVRNEPLILLDDSNSYWWLVKPLRSNTIGYIPAEIIETPYERLARVNQQKNVERALFRSNDIPGAPSKSTRPSLNPKTVVFPADPRGGFFQYSPAASDVSSDEDEEDYDPEKTKTPDDVASSGSADHSSDDDEADDDAMDVDAAASAADKKSDAELDADFEEPASRRSSLGAGLLLRQRDQFDDEDEDYNDELALATAAEPAASQDVEFTEADAAAAPAAEKDLRRSAEPVAVSIEEPVAKMVIDETPVVTVTPAAAAAPSSAAVSAGASPRATPSADLDDDDEPAVPAASEIDPITVLRIFPGNCAIPADVNQFKTVVVTKSMSVKELLRQAMLKYRVFGPLAAARRTDVPEETILADWYLTLSFNGAANGHHHVLNPDENVLGALAAMQKQAEEDAAPAATSSSAAALAKPRNMFARFASKLYTPTLLASTRQAKHHLAKPILHVISPQDSSSIRLMLHQHSFVASKGEGSPSMATRNLAPAAGPAAAATGAALIRVELQQPAPAAAVDPTAAVDELPVRMAKTLKVDRSSPASVVMRAALKKFSLAEGRSVGELPEFELYGPSPSTSVLALDAPLPLDAASGSKATPTFTLRRVATAVTRTTLTLAVTSPTVEEAAGSVKLRVPGPPEGSPRSPAPGEVVSPGSSNKRFSELFSEAQQLDLTHIFDEDAAAAGRSAPATAPSH